VCDDLLVGGGLVLPVDAATRVFLVEKEEGFVEV